MKKRWMLIPAMVGVVAIGSVAMADDSVPSVKKQAEKLISLQEAKQVAVQKVKDGIVTEIELDKDDGRYHFDIDLKDEKYEYELEVDAYTGEIIKFEEELLHGAIIDVKAQQTNQKAEPQTQVKGPTEKVAASTLKVAEPAKAKQAVKPVEKASGKSMLTKDQAIAIAKQHASGVVTEFELDDDDVYEIEMEDGNIEYELEIHAYTGAILSFERDED